MHKAGHSYSSSTSEAKDLPGPTVSPDENLDRDRSRANVITWRGMMTRLSTALYENQQGFEMNVMLVSRRLHLRTIEVVEEEEGDEKNVEARLVGTDTLILTLQFGN